MTQLAVLIIDKLQNQEKVKHQLKEVILSLKSDGAQFVTYSQLAESVK